MPSMRVRFQSKLPFKPLGSQSASEDRIKQNDVPSPRATASKVRPIQRSALGWLTHNARAIVHRELSPCRTSAGSRHPSRLPESGRSEAGEPEEAGQRFKWL